MCGLQLMYRECGAETRNDYLRFGSEDPANPAVTRRGRTMAKRKPRRQPRRTQRPLDIGFWNPMRDQIEMF